MACSSCCADRPLIPVNARTTTSDASKLDTTKVMKGVLRHDSDDDDSDDSDDSSDDDDEDTNESYNDLLATLTQQQPTKSQSNLSPQQLELSDIDLLSSIEPLPLPHLASILTKVTSSNLLTKQYERTLIQSKFPTALKETLSQSGNYTDGTPAGTKQWVGDVNAQHPKIPTYTSFGSILDISTSSTSNTNNNNIDSPSYDSTDTLTWIASLIHPKTLVQYTKDETNDELMKECRIDLLDDNDYDNYCFRGVTMDLNLNSNSNSEEDAGGGYVSVRTNEVARRQQLLLAKQLGIEEHGTFLSLNNKSILQAPPNFMKNKKFDTIIANGILMPTLSDEEMHYIPMIDMDLVLERLIKYLKPGGMIYIIGKDPLLYSGGDDEDEEDDTYYDGEEGEAGIIYKELMNVFETVKTVSSYI